MANETEPRTHFGGWLRKRRKERDLSQVALAEAVGVHPVTISAWECKEHQITRGSAYKIAAALGVPKRDVLQAAGYHVDDSLAAIVTGSSVICRHCSPECQAICSECQRLKIPALCERITETDWNAAWHSGVLDRLIEIRNTAIKIGIGG